MQIERERSDLDRAGPHLRHEPLDGLGAAAGDPLAEHPDRFDAPAERTGAITGVRLGKPQRVIEIGELLSDDAALQVGVADVEMRMVHKRHTPRTHRPNVEINRLVAELRKLNADRDRILHCWQEESHVAWSALTVRMNHRAIRQREHRARQRRGRPNPDWLHQTRLRAPQQWLRHQVYPDVAEVERAERAIAEPVQRMRTLGRAGFVGSQASLPRMSPLRCSRFDQRLVTLPAHVCLVQYPTLGNMIVCNIAEISSAIFPTLNFSDLAAARHGGNEIVNSHRVLWVVIVSNTPIDSQGLCNQMFAIRVPAVSRNIGRD